MNKSERSSKNVPKKRARQFVRPTPWHEPVDGAELLAELVTLLRHHLVLTHDEAIAVCAWTMFTYAHDAFTHSPILAIESAVPGCGKTTVATFLAMLVSLPKPTSNISKAVVFRLIDQVAPTLLIDEAETFAFRDPEMRGLLNSGHTRVTAFADRVNEDFEPQEFSTWAPKAIMYIGNAPDTIADRSIRIRLRRKLTHEVVARLPTNAVELHSDLRSRVARWADDNIEVLRDADPAIPRELRNRSRDNWRPLLAIADVLGGDWPEMMRTAARAISSDLEQAEGEALLEDVRRAFHESEKPRLTTETSSNY